MGAFLSALAGKAKTFQLVVVQILQRNILTLKRSRFFSPATQPDASIPAFAPYLYPTRIFRPSNAGSGNGGGLLPLLVRVHGGGFIMNNPSADDPQARFLADHAGCLVASIDYRKAPLHQFPRAYEDVVGSVLSLLDDSSSLLPIDRSRVVLGGSSAGGNLVLGAAQDPRLRGRVRGVVGLYPVASMAAGGAEQMATRPDPGVPDFIGANFDGVKDLYAGTRDAGALGDVRLSPGNFESRGHLPAKVMLIGCEHDMLCAEAKKMADRLMEAEEDEEEEKGEGDEDTRWMFVEGQVHGFDQFPKRGAAEERRLRDTELMYHSIAKWLKEEVF